MAEALKEIVEGLCHFYRLYRKEWKYDKIRKYIGCGGKNDKEVVGIYPNRDTLSIRDWVW